MTGHSSDDQQTKYRSAEELEEQGSRTRCRASAASCATPASSTTRPRRASPTDIKAVVEDATDWAEAQAGPGSGHRPAARLRRLAAGADGRPAVADRALHRRRRTADRRQRAERMAVMTLIESIRETLAREMRRDDDDRSSWARTWARRAASSWPPTGCTTSSAATACSTRR